MNGARVLIVDDEANARRVLEMLLSRLGCVTLSAPDGQAAWECLESETVDLVITDLNMPRLDGLGLLTRLREARNAVPVLMVTAYGTVESAVNAMKAGAFDYLVRPLDVDQVEQVVHRALEHRRIQRENDFLKAALEQDFADFVGQSAGMTALYGLIRQAAPSNASVLIQGETGTGKELVARALHRHSGRRGLFVPINCAAIPVDMLESELFGHVKGAFTGAQKDREGKFEWAQGGTLFLDEITEMSQPLQAKLLRVLQENVIERIGSNKSIAVDIRVVAATNRDPRLAIQQGALREDVFYRLNVFALTVPPLRARREDIPLLAQHFLRKYAGELGSRASPLSAAAEAALLAYDWPGNVRELENVMERAAVLTRGAPVEVRHLPQDLLAEPLARNTPADQWAGDLDLDKQVEQLERRLIAQALNQAGDNKAKAARLLQISERTLWYKLKKYGDLE